MGIRTESEWWYDAGGRDLAMAETLLRGDFFEGVAFHAQQAAEKFLKGLLSERGRTARTHSCLLLLERLAAAAETVSEGLLHHARSLDKEYVPSRYPNGVGGGAGEILRSQDGGGVPRAREGDREMGGLSKEVEVRLKRYAEALAATLRLSCLVVFGSRARGDALDESDLDLAIVSPDFEGIPSVRRWRRADGVPGAVSGADEVYLTPAELHSLGSLLVLDVVDEGVPIHDDGTFATARAKLESAMREGRLEREAYGWREREPASS